MFQRFGAVLICSLFLATPGLAEKTTLKMHASLSTRFARTIKIPLTRKDPVKHVIYGNQQYGYYALEVFKKTGSSLRIKLLPPGYLYPIDFHVGYETGKNKVTYAKAGTKKFVSPVPKAYEKQTGQLVSGEFSSNFFLVGGALPKQKIVDPNFTTTDTEIYKKDKYRFTFAQILNRFGEIVWIHVPTYRNAILSSYIATDSVGTGRFGMMFGKKAGFFSVVDFRGRVLKEFSSRFNRQPFTMHHDFHMPDRDTVMTLSNKVVAMPASKAKKGRNTFLTDVVVEVDLNKKTKIEKLDFLDFFKPWETSYWTGDKKNDKKFALWGQPKADFEFTHVNSIDHYPGQGYLVSIRNLNKIALFDESMKKLLWSLGPNKEDTFRITRRSDQYLHQHTPTLLKNGNVLLFDNGRNSKTSQLTVYKLDKAEGEARKIWSYEPNPPLFAKNRCSVVRLKNSNVLAYFVSPVVKLGSPPPAPNVDYLMEIDRFGKQKALMTRTFETLTPGYRAVPMDDIGFERYLGRDLAKAFRAENR
jgi:hypothetical protein